MTPAKKAAAKAPKQGTAKAPEKKIGPAKLESGEALKARALRISAGLHKAYPKVQTALDSETPFQLLIATILSAQCTDVAVNKATPGLFKLFPTPDKLAESDPAQVEKLIGTITFYKNKTKSIRACAAKLRDEFAGKVPESMEELVTLPGVGRKTANVVRGCAFGLPAIIVDTHVKRVSARLGLTETEDPEVIEQDLMALLPAKHWTHFTNAMIWHGRQICIARKPRCPECPLLKDCPYGQGVLGNP